MLGELKTRLSGVEFVYLGDTAHVPYGTRSAAQVRSLSSACARRLRERGVDAVVVACNTASSLAMDAIRGELGAVPVFGVLEPGVEAATAALGSLERILVLATRATVRSGAYGRMLRERAAGMRRECEVLEIACPLLVPMIEEGWVDHPILHRTIEEYVGGMDRGPGVALLACTHYPWIEEAFARALPGWKVVNSARAVADAVTRLGGWGSGGRAGGVEWIFTDPDAVPEFARRWIGELAE